MTNSNTNAVNPLFSPITIVYQGSRIIDAHSGTVATLRLTKAPGTTDKRSAKIQICNRAGEIIVIKSKDLKKFKDRLDGFITNSTRDVFKMRFHGNLYPQVEIEWGGSTITIGGGTPSLEISDALGSAVDIWEHDIYHWVVNGRFYKEALDNKEKKHVLDPERGLSMNLIPGLSQFTRLPNFVSVYKKHTSKGIKLFISFTSGKSTFDFPMEGDDWVRFYELLSEKIRLLGSDDKRRAALMTYGAFSALMVVVNKIERTKKEDIYTLSISSNVGPDCSGVKFNTITLEETKDQLTYALEIAKHLF